MQAAGLILTSYQDSLARAMDVTANNIANVNTTGYKRESIGFETYMARPATNYAYHFSIDYGTYRDSGQGPTFMTGNAFDIAIQGKGYIPVQTEEGIRYTRSGAFQLNEEGDLVTAAGDKVLGDGDQTITFPSDAREVLIASDGTITAQSGGGGVTQIGKLSVVAFEDEQSLVPIGNSLYSATETPQPATESRLVQGAIEQSNVQAVTEMTRMIDVSRTYQQVARLLEIENERQATAIQRLGKTTAA